MSASNEKARRANARRNFHTFYRMNNSTIPGAMESARLRHFARRIHALSERALLELFLELVADANLADRLPVDASIPRYWRRSAKSRSRLPFRRLGGL